MHEKISSDLTSQERKCLTEKKNKPAILTTGCRLGCHADKFDCALQIFFLSRVDFPVSDAEYV